MPEFLTAKHRKDLLAAGRFAQATQLSRKALRLYDQLGILTPHCSDRQTGYRYYSIDQIERACFIRMLRAMEMPLADVHRVLNAKTNEAAIQIVIDCQNEFETKASQVQSAYQKVLSYLKKEEIKMMIDISVKSIPACNAICLKKNITVPAFHQFIPEALERLFTSVKEAGVQVVGEPICFYYGPVNESDNGPVEICLPTQDSLDSGGGITFQQIPAHLAAIAYGTLEQNQYPAILDVWEAVMGWVYANKYSLDESVSCYEIWHEDHSISVAQPIQNYSRFGSVKVKI